MFWVCTADCLIYCETFMSKAGLLGELIKEQTSYNNRNAVVGSIDTQITWLPGATWWINRKKTNRFIL